MISSLNQLITFAKCKKKQIESILRMNSTVFRTTRVVACNASWVTFGYGIYGHLSVNRLSVAISSTLGTRNSYCVFVQVRRRPTDSPTRLEYSFSKVRGGDQCLLGDSVTEAK